MKKNLLLVFIFLSLNLYSVVEETASFKGFIYGNAPECEYDNWQTHITENIADPGYNQYAPYDRQLSGFGQFVDASTDDLLNWQSVVVEFLEGNLDEAQELIDGFDFPYDVVIFHDTDTDRTYYLLRERLNMDYYDDNETPNFTGDDEIGGFDYGWGLYVYYPEASLPVIVTTPHPTDDYTTTVIGHKTFVDFDAMFWIVSGAGREVLWDTEATPYPGYYSNSKSISDASRNLNHPFNKAYRKFCDKIRDDFGQRELSVQVHGYDWGTSHPGFANTQVSAGYLNENPGLPIRDLSSRKIDLIQNSDVIIHSQDSHGVHPDIHLNDYYAVVYSDYGFVYDDGGDGIVVNNHYDLSGYSQNKQMQYSKVGWNNYDIFEPFFHIEMDELPNEYPQNIENYHWFYGWDAVNQVWDPEKRFTMTLDYYGYWIEKMAEILPEVLAMDDGEVPPTPQNFQVITQANDYIKLKWDRLDCFDFDTFEILYSTEPIENGNYSVINRDNVNYLACMATESYKVTNLTPNTTYYFQMRAVDKNGNTSALTEELTGFSSPNIVDDFEFIAGDNQVYLTWVAEMQTELLGFQVFRDSGNGMQPIGDLLDSNNSTEPQIYEYTDSDVENGETYLYQIGMFTFGGELFMYGEVLEATPEKVWEIQFSAGGLFSSNLKFGYNKAADDFYDGEYDLDINPETNEDYLVAYFYEPTWDDGNLNYPIKYEQEIYGYYDAVHELKSWSIILKTDQLNTPINVSLLNNDRDAERMYLKIGSNYVNLLEEDYTFSTESDSDIPITLYYGNMDPQISISELPREILYPNTEIDFNWGFSHSALIESVDLYLKNNEVEFLLAEDLTPYTNSFSWNIPEVDLEDLHLFFKLHMVEGDTLEKISDSNFSIQPANQYLYTYSGWNMTSTPFTDMSDAVEDIYGATSVFYQLDGTEFLESDIVEYGVGYWQYSEDDFQTNYDGFYENNDFQLILHQGWNLIPNPFIVDFDLNDLILEMNNAIFQYSEAIQYNLIQPNVYGYSDGYFVPTDTMEPKKAYYIYSYQDDLQLNFEIYNNNDIDAEFAHDWNLRLIAMTEYDKSAVELGASESASNGYDNNYDLLKPDLKPIANQIELSILEEDHFLQRSISKLIKNEDEIYLWNARLANPNLEPINFSADFFDVPANYNAYLIIDDDYFRITEDNSLQFTFENPITDFSILISDAAANSQEDIVIPKLALGNYPNPFTSSNGRSFSTTIFFSLPNDSKKAKIEIYNVKGQKVNTLLNTKIEAGEHQIHWNGENKFGKKVASGVYFAKLSSNDKTLKVHKMMLLK